MPCRRWWAAQRSAGAQLSWQFCSGKTASQALCMTQQQCKEGFFAAHWQQACRS